VVEGLGPLPSVRKAGDEPITNDGVPLGVYVGDFWRWSASDLLGNTSRGVLAEYLVALALKVPVTGVREEWSPCDLTTPEGITVQVKSAAFVQSWFQKRPSFVSFSIKPARAWDPETNTLASAPARHAQVYVFALLAHTEESSIDPLKLEQWRFFAVSTRRLEERYGERAAISLASLKDLVGEGRRFEELRPEVLAAAASC
jgi:hypothetical protein